MSLTITLEEFSGWLRQPVSLRDLLSDLEPPTHFAHAAFDNYEVDDRFPSQHAVVDEVQSFATSSSSKSFLHRLISGRHPMGTGLYLDGGFGVGKTHLLASAFHSHHGRKSFISFQELMFLVGLQRLENTVSTFSQNALLVIDEFELDDPANTRIATNLLAQLFAKGVNILTSSNTAPGALGEGKFSVEAFRRELGELFAQFDSVRLDGEDYRKTHRIAYDPHSSPSPRWMMPGAPALSADRMLVAEFKPLIETLATAHPIRVRRSLTQLRALHMENVTTIADPHAALRFVYFIDKIYDDDIALSATSGIAIDDIFSPAIFGGGDTKKYLRCISRLVELTA